MQRAPTRTAKATRYSVSSAEGLWDWRGRRERGSAGNCNESKRRKWRDRLRVRLGRRVDCGAGDCRESVEGVWSSDLQVRLKSGDQRRVGVGVGKRNGRTRRRRQKTGRTSKSEYVQYSRTYKLVSSCQLVQLAWQVHLLNFFEAALHQVERRHLRGRLRSHLGCKLCDRLNNVPGNIGLRVKVRGCCSHGGGRGVLRVRLVPRRFLTRAECATRANSAVEATCELRRTSKDQACEVGTAARVRASNVARLKLPTRNHASRLTRTNAASRWAGGAALLRGTLTRGWADFLRVPVRRDFRSGCALVSTTQSSEAKSFTCA